MTFSGDLKQEYAQTRRALLEQTAQSVEPAEVRKGIDSTLAMCTANQAQIALSHIDTGFKAGILIESESLSRKVPAYTGFDFSKVPKTHVNKITKDTIGHIGVFNKELADTLKWQYAEILNDNAIVNSLNEHGFTANVEKKMLKAGLSEDAITLIKHQSTTNKMVEILETHGIRGGTHPYNMVQSLQPFINQCFGANGQVVIDNVGKSRRILRVTAQGEHWWESVVNTRKYVTSVQNYSDIVARTTMLKAHNQGRVETLQQSGLVKEYRYICGLTGNSCDVCIGMHGSIVDPSDVMPPVHPRCGCRLQAVWKENTGRKNHTKEYYEQQQNKAIYRRYKFKEYNKSVDKMDRLENEALLPRSDYLPLPGKTEMQKIRKEVIG